MWPAAILSVLHRTIVLTTNGNITDDFKPVYRAVLNFRHGWDIYNEHFDYVDPHYLYPPGGTLLMAPFGYLPFAPSRYLFILINTVAILIAWYLLLRLFNFTLSSVAAPALLLAMFCTETVTSTLVFTNINGCILLLEVLFLRWLLDGKDSRPSVVGRVRDRADVGAQTRAGTPAVAAAAEPPVAGAGAGASWCPWSFNLAALPLVSHPMDFVTRTLPYIAGRPRLLQQLDRGQRRLLRPADLADRVPANPVHGAGHRRLWLLYRYYRTRDPLFWFTTSSGVLLLWSWLVLSLAQGYYSMMLFPFLMTVVLPNSVIRNWPAWLGIYGFLTLDHWLLFNWMTIGPRAGIPEDHLRLVAAADRGVHRAVLPLPGRQGRKPAGRRDRSGVADGRAARALAWMHD